MKKKSLLSTLMIGVAVMMSACTDDVRNTPDEPVEEQDTLTYSLTCASSVSCKLELETNQQGSITVQLSSKDTKGMVNLVGGKAIHIQSQSSLFKMQDGSASAFDFVTDALGQTTIVVSSLDTPGTGQIFFSTDADLVQEPLIFTVVVKAPIVEPVVEPKDYNYNVKMTYEGIQQLAKAEALVYPGRSCSQIIKTGMTDKEVGNLKDFAANKDQVIDTSIDNVSLDFTFNETDPVAYAVVGRARNADTKYAAYGCTDNMNRFSSNVLVELEDSQITEDTPGKPPVIKPDDPTPGPEPEYTTDYSGKFALVSSFNALSLLPHADVPDGSIVMFKDMQAGDWIEFALALLSDPEATVPDILTQQLIPLLTNAEWFRNLIAKFAGDAIAAMLTPEFVDTLLETFGVKKIITDTLTNLTSEITWWNDAKGGIEIARELATNFTLSGTFNNKTSDVDENNMIAGIGHTYSSLLYHNGTFSKCLIGHDYGADAKGDKICEISLATLDKEAGSVSGAFTAEFSEITDNAATVNIKKHNLGLQYGKLIYASIMQILPTFIKANDGKPFDTIGSILEYYIGEGLVTLWNTKKAADEADMITGKSRCNAIGAASSKLIASAWPAGAMLLTESMISMVCTMGINAFDKMIDNTLEKASYSSDKVAFSSDNCPITFITKADNTNVISHFGQSDYTWNGKTDKRCTWNVSIQGKEGSQPKTIKGKFWAVNVSSK
ncbi:MAG: hypothetical protein IJ268_13985 [Proteobacteria bacterium]|nr:hypothetical protein [Pseudomonadota bacterium]